MTSLIQDVARRALKPILPDGVVRRLGAVRRTILFLSDPKRTVSYNPSAPSKGPFRVALDHMWWILRYGEVYDAYFLVGQDVKGTNGVSDYHSYKCRMRAISRTIRERGDEDLAELMKDKSRFAAVAEDLGYPSPRNIAVLTPTGIERPPGAEESPYEKLTDWDGLDGFCKPVRGRYGGGTFTLCVDGGHIILNGRSATPMEVQRQVRERCLLQDRIHQHEELSALYPGSINTVRLITAHKDGEVFPFHAALRLGANGSIVDNWSAGGLIVDVDLETGRLARRGFYKPGLQPHDRMTATRHPDTGVVFDGYSLPDFAAAREIVCQFHRDLNGLLTIGWDVSLTPSGPVIIEGNTHWDGRVYMASDPYFRDRYHRLLSAT